MLDWSLCVRDFLKPKLKQNNLHFYLTIIHRLSAKRAGKTVSAPEVHQQTRPEEAGGAARPQGFPGWYHTLATSTTVVVPQGSHRFLLMIYSSVYTGLAGGFLVLSSNWILLWKVSYIKYLNIIANRRRHVNFQLRWENSAGEWIL